MDTAECFTALYVIDSGLSMPCVIRTGLVMMAISGWEVLHYWWHVRTPHTGDLRSVQAGDVPPISRVHFEDAFDAVAPSVSPADLQRYIDWNSTFGSFRRMVWKCPHRNLNIYHSQYNARDLIATWSPCCLCLHPNAKTGQCHTRPLGW